MFFGIPESQGEFAANILKEEGQLYTSAFAGPGSGIVFGITGRKSFFFLFFLKKTFFYWSDRVDALNS